MDVPSLEEHLENEGDPGRRLDLIEEVLCPPEPQLLDTCVLQNLDWVDRVIAAGGGQWTEERECELQTRFGLDLSNDLLDLGTLYKRFESDGGYPWLVCNAAVDEADALKGAKGDGVRQLIQFLIGHQEEWVGDAYPGIAQGLLLACRRARVSPLILRGLGVSAPEEIVAPSGPLSFLPDRGDRLVASYALLANIPVILTTDRRTFWAHREQMREFGVQVLRPTELLDLYFPYWEALSAEFERRRRGKAPHGEALVHGRLDPSLAAFIVVWNDWVKKEVQEVYTKAGITPPMLRFGGYDENHTFVHFRKELPDDMRQKSIACGPMLTRRRFDTVLEADAAVSTRPRPRFSSLVDLLTALRANGLNVLPETAELIDLESENEVHTQDVGRHTLKVVQTLRASSRFAALSPEDQNQVELAAYLHDIGKGPKSRWTDCGGKQQVDADHPIRSAEMLPRILSDEIHLDRQATRVLCKLVCYHDLVGDILGKDRQRSQLAEVAENERDLDMLIALGGADMASVNSMWAWTGEHQIPELRQWVLAQMNHGAGGSGNG